ncbi:unnamed protein product [Adineta steineri]|uniref:Uncharacterized protein n=1 Tax=Adineta steineri TaxID=433720 RepID=A0A814K3V0_9BILA|nr:unnamed protein product [Adineta steineri]
MNHSSHSNEPSSHRYISFQSNLSNDLLHNINFKSLNHHDSESTHINTGIIYLPLPEPRLQLAKPQQSLDFKHQTEQDFYTRYQYINDEDLNYLLNNIQENDANRYKLSYHHLYQSVFQSILNSIDLNEEIIQLKHSIIYQNEILPILINNHKLAKREKKILYNISRKSWQKFDECIQSEVNIQYQLEQIKKEHQNLKNLKIKQEQYQTFYLKLHEINNDTTQLKRDQLQEEIHETKTHCSHNIIQLNILKSNILRSHTNELNNLQLERDSLITQTELIKYNLFEQIQQFDNILNNYRTSLNSFRLTLYELEQQLKQQTDNELINLQIFNSFQRQTIYDDTNQLILILENKIDEKNSLKIQLEKSIENYQENILKQKQLLIKKENDYKTMDHIDQQLNDNLNIHREMYLQLKTERRSIDRQLRTNLKQYANDDRLNHTLIQQHDSLLARKKIDQIRIHAFNERIYPLMDENNRLKTFVEQLHRQYTQINPNNLIELRQDILHLKQTYQTLKQQKLHNYSTKHNYEKKDQQLKIKNNQMTNRMKNILNRIQQNERDFKDNYQHIQILENKIIEEQHYYLQLKYTVTDMKNRSESYRTKQHSIQMQAQVAVNNIKYSQYRLKTFTDQLIICHNDAIEQKTSLNKLREYYSTLKEHDEINLKKLSTIYEQYTNLQNQYKISINSLQQTNENLTKYLTVRSSLGRMVVRRVNLCQLLYKKIVRFDEHIHQQDQSIQMISKCINSIKLQIHQIRNENKKFVEKKDKFQFETVKIHMTKILDHSHEKQRLLTKQIFQRHFSIKHSLNPLPFEEQNYLRNKFYLLKTRLIKIIFRGIISNFVLLSIQQEFSNLLEDYTSNTWRENSSNLNFIRTNLYQLIRQLKAKTAENNMLIDYQHYLQFIHTDIIQQIIQWKSKFENLFFLNLLFYLDFNMRDTT